MYTEPNGTIEHPFNRTPSQLMRAHDAIIESLAARDYHSAHQWVDDAEKMEMFLNADVVIFDDKGSLGYITDSKGLYHRIYEQDII